MDRGFIAQERSELEQGIDAQLKIESIDKVQRGDGPLLFSLRASLADFIAATVASERVVRHLHALVLGRQDSLQEAENLRAIIIEKTGSRRDIPVSIVADGDTRHAMVVMSMDTVSQLGFKRLSISTQRPAAGE